MGGSKSAKGVQIRGGSKSAVTPDEWALSAVVSILKGKGDAMSCGAYRGVKLLEHTMKIVEKVLERRMWRMVKVD